MDNRFTLDEALKTIEEELVKSTILAFIYEEILPSLMFITED